MKETMELNGTDMNNEQNWQNNSFTAEECRGEKIYFPGRNLLPRCAVMLVLDTSHSMWGEGLKDMMASLQVFYATLKQEQMMNAPMDIASVSMGENLRMLEEFTPIEQSVLPTMQIRPKGDTPIAAALQLALNKLKEQHRWYRENGLNYVAPKLLILSDGHSTDDTTSIAEEVRELVACGKLECYVVATGATPNWAVLKSIAGDKVQMPMHRKMPPALSQLGKMVSQTYEAAAMDQMASLCTAENMDVILPEIVEKAAPPSVLLDGTNIIHWDEQRTGCTLKYLMALTEYFEESGISYQVFFDASARYHLPEEERATYESLISDNPEHFRQTPAGTRADDFLLVLADAEPSGYIISNDRFRDYEDQYPWLKSERRVISGMVLNKMVFLPDMKLKISL